MKKEDISKELDILRAAAAEKKILIDGCEDGLEQLKILKKKYEEICLDIHFLIRYYRKLAGVVQ